MTRKDTQDSDRRSFFEEVFRGVLGFFEAFNHELSSSSALEREVASVKQALREQEDKVQERLEIIEGNIQRITEEGVRDTQELLGILQDVQQQTAWLVEKSQQAQDEEQARRWKKVLEGLRDLLIAGTAVALYDAVVQEEVYPQLKQGLQQLVEQIDQSLERLDQFLERPTATPEVTPEPTPQPPSIPATSLEPEMIFIPAGRFLMGSDPQKDKNAWEDEQPQHSLYLPGYYIAKTPVTHLQYAAFVRATGHRAPSRNEAWAKSYSWSEQTPPRDKANHPVVLVSWHDAVAYCRWLSRVTGKPYRLPSEAEWEKAARGTDGRIYPWGNQWDASRCNSKEGRAGGTTPVGAYPKGASPYGVLDMAGNVWEWTRSLYKPYRYNPDDGREDPEAPGARVLRGGSWDYDQHFARCAFRYRFDPNYSNYNLGFRVVSPVVSGS